MWGEHPVLGFLGSCVIFFCLVAQWQIILLIIIFRCQCRPSTFCLLWEFFTFLGVSVCSGQAVSSWLGNYPSFPPPRQSSFCPLMVNQTLYSSPLLWIVQKLLTEHLCVNRFECTFENTSVVLCLNRVGIFDETAKRDMAGWETEKDKMKTALILLSIALAFPPGSPN